MCHLAYCFNSIQIISYRVPQKHNTLHFVTTETKIQHKCIFVIVFGPQNCLLDEKMALKKAIPNVSFTLKIAYQTYLLDEILVIRYSYCR